jgi:hypothetical protein
MGPPLARQIGLNQVRKEDADAAQDKKRYDEPNHETDLDKNMQNSAGLAAPQCDNSYFRISCRRARQYSR